MSADKFSEIFSGLEEAYGTYEIQKQQVNGKQSGQASVLRSPRTAQTWEGHLSGKGPAIGIIPINADNNCKWGCIDIDQYTGFNHKELLDKIVEMKLPLVVCRSKSGGAHVFLFSKDWISAKILQDTLTSISAALGYAGSEIFPKQIKLQLDRGDVGNFLNLPYYNHEESLRYAFKADGSAATLEEFFGLYEAAVQTVEQIEALSVEKQDRTPIKDGPPCLQHLCNQGFPEGTRNNGLFNVGVYLRKAFPDTWENELMQYNMAHFDPPLPLAEVNILVRQLNRKDYQYKCSDAPINEFCDKDKCLTRKYGVGNVGQSASVANLRKYNSKPPIWFMDVNGEPLELSTEGLQSQAAFQKSCIEQLNVMPPTVSKNIWENRVAALLRDMTETEGGVMEASEDSSIDGAFYDYLEDFCRNMQTAADKEEILLRRPWTDEEKKQTFFRLRDLENFLKRQRFFEFKTHQISQRLRDIGGESTILRISGRVVRVWAIPAYEISNTTVKSPEFEVDEQDIPF
tara:strand:+ start:308 stop:1849 length:1542 start_codon:yes stop_codon:yes gene_type:complete